MTTGFERRRMSHPLTARVLFERMALIRASEERLLTLFSEGKLHGTTHTGIGQEAVAVAVCGNLAEADIVFSPHRCHGHYLAYGGPSELLFAEVMGRETGLCRGRGGSQHLCYGRFHSSGVQGGIVGNAVGAALALRMQRSNDIVVVFLGDGTLGEGLVYESLNFAALQKLPILFVVENNRYAQTTPVDLGVSGSMQARAEAFGIPSNEIESNDALELSDLFAARIASVRGGSGPLFQVVHTYRLSPHSKGDDHRDLAEIDAWRLRDPLLLMRRHMDAAEADALQAEAVDLVDRAVVFAESSPQSIPEGVPLLVPQGAPPTPFVCEALSGAKALNRALGEILRDDPKAFVMGEDVLDPYGGAFGVMRGLSSAFGGRVITTPISEAGIVAWGTGAALAGQHPIVEIMFGDFLALAADQLLNHAAKYGWVSAGRLNVPLVVRTPMGGRRGYGPTHSQSIESMFLGIPGLLAVAPSALLDPGALLERAVRCDAPVLFIENKGLYAKPLVPVTEGRAGHWYVRGTESWFPTLHVSPAAFEPADVALVAYGANAAQALDVAQALMLEYEIVADVVVPSLLAPTPIEEIAGFVGSPKLVATVEEGQKPCGWGAEILAGLTEMGRTAPRFVRYAAQSTPIPAARTLESAALPQTEAIVQDIARILR